MVGTAPNKADCIRYYTFDSDGTDSSATGDDATVTGATQATGKLNNGYDFDGVNDDIAIPTAIGTHAALSFNAWGNFDNLSSSHTIVSVNGSTDYFRIYYHSSNIYFQMNINGSLKQFFTTPAALGVSAGTYYMFSSTYDGTNVRFYVNAVLKNTIAATGSIVLDSASTQHIGWWSGVGRYMDGVIDEPSIWDAALTGDNLTYLYNAGSPGTAQQYPFTAAPSSGDCIAYWKMEDTSDSSANSNTLSINGATNVASKLDNGYDFDGTNDSITCTTISIAAAAAKTVMGWVWIDAVTGADYIMDSNVSGERFILGLNPSSTGNFEFYDNSAWRDTGQAYATGAWHHVAITVDSAGTDMNFYYDGTQVYNVTCNASKLGTLAFGSNQIVTGSWLNGKLDEWAVFDTELTPNNISYIYNAGSPGTAQQYPFPVAPDSADCVGYWKLEDLTDEVGSNNLTNSGATSGATGIIDNGYDFDGANDQMQFATTPVTGTSARTYSLWLNPDVLVANARLLVTGNTLTAGQEFSIVTKDTGHVWFNSAGSQQRCDNLTISASSYNHIAVTFPSGGNTSDVKIYINGVEETSYTTASDTALNTSSANAYLGSTGTSLYINGKIDELAAFDAELTSNEISYLYNAGSPGTAQQYPFTGGGASGWTGTFLGVTNPAKILGIAVANIAKVNGVE